MQVLQLVNSTTLIVIALAVFVSVLGVAFAVRTALNPERTAQDRIKDLTSGDNKPKDRLGPTSESVFSVASNIGKLAQPQQEDQANLLRQKLAQAGYRGRNALEVYSGARATLALILPFLVFFIMPSKTMTSTMVWTLVAAAVGYYLPALLVENARTKRQQAFMKPFPDALDLLVSSVEAGLGLDAAFRRVADEITTAAPELANELQMVNNEANAGISRVDALRHLDERTGLPEVKSLVNVLTQAERFGTSVARALRVHADLVRTQRMLAAEEKAAMISPKLTVVMILFIMPSLFLVLIGPAIIKVFRILLPTLGGA